MRPGHRDRQPGNLRNWELRCRICEHSFPMNITMGVVAAHWNLHVGAEHPDAVEDAPQLDLTWVGLGAPPKSRPEGF